MYLETVCSGLFSVDDKTSLPRCAIYQPMVMRFSRLVDQLRLVCVCWLRPRCARMNGGAHKLFLVSIRLRQVEWNERDEKQRVHKHHYHQGFCFCSSHSGGSSRPKANTSLTKAKGATKNEMKKKKTCITSTTVLFNDPVKVLSVWNRSFQIGRAITFDVFRFFFFPCIFSFINDLSRYRVFMFFSGVLLFINGKYCKKVKVERVRAADKLKSRERGTVIIGKKLTLGGKYDSGSLTVCWLPSLLASAQRQ